MPSCLGHKLPAAMQSGFQPGTQHGMQTKGMQHGMQPLGANGSVPESGSAGTGAEKTGGPPGMLGVLANVAKGKADG